MWRESREFADIKYLKRILAGIRTPRPSEPEIQDDWLMEAYNRARALDEGKVQPIPAEEVRRKAKALFR